MAIPKIKKLSAGRGGLGASPAPCAVRTPDRCQSRTSMRYRRENAGE
ncbi:MAG: hypothetical protein AB9879_12570 [Methanothrix sp.]